MIPQWSAFLSLIARAEGTSSHPLTKNDGYDVIVTGDVAAGEVGLEIFDVYQFHPFESGRPAKIIRTQPDVLRSSASGRYQLELHWWLAYKNILGLKDFSPASQDAVALRQISERGGLRMLVSGDVQGAIKACSNIWASFPGNTYGQPQKELAQLVEWYDELLNSKPPQEELA